MDIQIHEKEGVKIMRIRGSLDTNTSSEAEVLFREVLQEGATRLLLDFSELDYISSAGLRVLLTTSKQLLGRGQLGIFNPNEQIREVFEMTGLIGLIFNIFESEGQAMQNFETGR
ncbi:MAG: STAS domain-containing protein [Phaeodactylibacter sp.]|nr:STAS domain-containing protein [Phaeodactylibacter sp.]